MNQIQLNDFTICYSTTPTAQCPIQLDSQIFIEDRHLPLFFIGKNTLSAFAFYQATCPKLTEKAFELPTRFKKILQRMPATNTKNLIFDEKAGYSFTNIPIYISGKDWLIGMIQAQKYPKFQEQLLTIQDLSPVMDQEDLRLTKTKYKQLLLDGTYGARKNLSNQNLSLKSIQHKLMLERELYYFNHYHYAGMIGFKPEYNVTTYEQFHELYGQYIYSFTLTKNGQTIPLLWPDYLYHQPENHLEFGILNDPSITRYHLLQNWREQEAITIELLADGFEDVVFDVCLKKPQSPLPAMSQKTYTSTDNIAFTLDPELLTQLQQQDITFTIVTPNKTNKDGYTTSYHVSKGQVILDAGQFLESGLYQLSIVSERFGEVLLLFQYQYKENA